MLSVFPASEQIKTTNPVGISPENGTTESTQLLNANTAKLPINSELLSYTSTDDKPDLWYTQTSIQRTSKITNLFLLRTYSKPRKILKLIRWMNISNEIYRTFSIQSNFNITNHIPNGPQLWIYYKFPFRNFRRLDKYLFSIKNGLPS